MSYKESMFEVSVVIPNYNGLVYLEGVLSSLEKQTLKNFEVILVDNGSSDASCAYIEEHYPWVRILKLGENFGFCRAVNEGIRASKSELVLLLNNDIEARPNFLQEMTAGIKRHKNAFSCAAKMLQFHNREKIDDAGNFYCALGWSYARGKDQDSSRYQKEEPVFAACAGAAIYRKELFEKLGYFDEEHFAYLEDVDMGYRARIHGYENWYLPKAVVYHVGSGTTGSRYNQFKTRYSSRNNVYLVYKNMPFIQLLLNMPFLAAGFGIKVLFFCRKGMGREYIAGIKNGFQISKKDRKVKYSYRNTWNYIKIQWELWVNIARRFVS